MEARNLGYSMKNIPIPPKQRYLKNMIEKAESFIVRLRWKAHFFDKKEHSVNNMNFGFKSNFTSLINPSKGEMCVVSKNFLEEIN